MDALTEVQCIPLMSSMLEKKRFAPDISLMGSKQVIGEGHYVIEELYPDIPVSEVLAPVPIFARSQVLEDLQQGSFVIEVNVELLVDAVRKVCNASQMQGNL